jgi:hypothetical protein
LTTCYGDIHIANTHAFSKQPNGFSVSPLVQYKCLLISQLLPYQKGVDLAATLAQIQTNNNFLHRLVGYYGQQLTNQVASSCPMVAPPQPLPTPGHESLVVPPATAQLASPVAYALADGSMLLTETGYREAKLGRVFPQSACEGSRIEGRNGQLSESIYCARLGEAVGFKPLFCQTLQAYEAAGYRLVFLSDGAIWLRQMMASSFPRAVLILDFFHAVEWLGKAAQGCISRPKAREKWLKIQTNNLLSSKLDTVLGAIDALKGPADLLAEVRAYLASNRDRMDYAQYVANGWLIGSGAVESAHRTLLQSRLKLSGQRWSEAGANRLIALRVYVANGWHQAIRELIEACPARYAMAA